MAKILYENLNDNVKKFVPKLVGNSMLMHFGIFL